MSKLILRAFGISTIKNRAKIFKDILFRTIMVKQFLLFAFVALVLFASTHVVSAQSASGCALNVTLVNQDPYPSIPNDYVKVVFKLTGLEGRDCQDVNFQVVQDYPFSADPGTPLNINVSSGTYTTDYSSYVLLPFKLRVDPNAVDGENDLQVEFSSTSGGSHISQIKKFPIQIKNALTDFEVSIKDYVESTRTITFEILNTGKGDAQALTVDIPQQNTLTVKGSSRSIIGNLNSYEDTSFSYEAIPSAGPINMVVSYTDSNEVRREINKTVSYDPVYFTNRVRDIKSSPTTTYAVVIIIIALIVFWIIRRRVKNKRRHKQMGK